MPSVATNRMMDRIRTNLPGALDATIQTELFQAADEFFRATNAWRQSFDFEVDPLPQPLTNDPDAYLFPVLPPTGAMTYRLMNAVDGNNFPVHAGMPQTNYVQFYQQPNTTSTYSALFSLTVVDPVTRDGYPVIPDWLIQKYGDTLAQGTMAKMMLQVAKPYSSPEQAALHYAEYKKGVGKARIGIERSSVYNGQNWRFPQTFKVRRY